MGELSEELKNVRMGAPSYLNPVQVTAVEIATLPGDRNDV
jgi:hypothetical protein